MALRPSVHTRVGGDPHGRSPPVGRRRRVMTEATPTPPWSLARVAREQTGGDLAVWTADAVHSRSLQGRIEIDTAIQQLLADGYEPFRVTQDGSYHCLWFKARLPRPSATP